LKSAHNPNKKANIAKFIKKLENHGNGDFKQIYDDMKAKKYDQFALFCFLN
jgi:hypothetical protein